MPVAKTIGMAQEQLSVIGRSPRATGVSKAAPSPGTSARWPLLTPPELPPYLEGSGWKNVRNVTVLITYILPPFVISNHSKAWILSWIPPAIIWIQMVLQHCIAWGWNQLNIFWNRQILSASDGMRAVEGVRGRADTSNRDLLGRIVMPKALSSLLQPRQISTPPVTGERLTDSSLGKHQRGRK
jgi:hypothetical protein